MGPACRRLSGYGPPVVACELSLGGAVSPGGGSRRGGSRGMRFRVRYADVLSVNRASANVAMALNAPPSAGSLISERLAAARSAAGGAFVEHHWQLGGELGALWLQPYRTSSHKWSFLRFKPEPLRPLTDSLALSSERRRSAIHPRQKLSSGSHGLQETSCA